MLHLFVNLSILLQLFFIFLFCGDLQLPDLIEQLTLILIFALYQLKYSDRIA